MRNLNLVESWAVRGVLISGGALGALYLGKL